MMTGTGTFGAPTLGQYDVVLELRWMKGPQFFCSIFRGLQIDINIRFTDYVTHCSDFYDDY